MSEELDDCVHRVQDLESQLERLNGELVKLLAAWEKRVHERPSYSCEDDRWLSIAEGILDGTQICHTELAFVLGQKS